MEILDDDDEKRLYFGQNNIYIIELRTKISGLKSLKSFSGDYKRGKQTFVIEFKYNNQEYKVTYQISLVLTNAKMKKGLIFKEIVDAYNIACELDYVLSEKESKIADIIKKTIKIKKCEKLELIQFITDVLSQISEKLAKETRNFVFKL